jgi:hypothetical protein
MADEPEQQVSKKVVYETHDSTTSRSSMPAIIAIAVIAIALITYILMHLR